MATLVVYAKASDGYINSSHSDYAIARAGGSLGYDSSGAYVICGQRNSSAVFYCYEAFFQYDTSSLFDTAIVTAAKEELYLYSDLTTTDYTEEVRTFDWGDTLTTADWVAGANLGNYTLLSSKAVSPSAGYNEFPTSANFIAAINTTGDTRLFHSSDRHRLGNEPTEDGDEYIMWYSTDQTGTDNDLKLTIDYTIGGGSISTVNISSIGGGYEALYGGSNSTVNISAIGG